MDADKELIGKLNKLITSAVNYRKSQRDEEYINNQAHYEGVYWNLASYNSDSPFILKSDINHVKNAIDLRLASIYANDYCGDLLPMSPDDTDTVDVLETLYKYEWKRLGMNSFIKKIIKDAVVLGDGYLQISYDPDKIIGGTKTRMEGLIKVNYIHATTVYIDPSATSEEDADYIVYKTRRSKDWVERERPSWMSKLKEASADSTTYSGGQEDGELYSSSRDYTNEQDNLFILNTICLKEKFENKTKDGEKVIGTKVNIYYIINNTIVESNIEFPFDFFDIAKISCEDIPQTPYGLPLMRGLTVPCKVANLIESAINNVAMHYTVPSWMISEESGIDIDEFAKLQAALGVVFKVSGDVKTAIAQVPYPIIDDKLVQYGKEFVNYIRMYAGVNDQYMGNIGSAGNTSGGTNAAIARATAIDVLLIEQIEKFVENFSRKLIKYMIKYYADKEIFIRDKNNKKYTFKSYTIKQEFDDIDFDFSIDLTYKTRNDKDRQYSELKNIYQLQNQYKDSKPLIRSLDLVKAAQLDEFSELFKRNLNLTEEAWAEKIELALQIMPSLGLTDANGVALVTPEEFQKGMIDIFNDDNDLEVVTGIIKKMEMAQEQSVEPTPTV